MDKKANQEQVLFRFSMLRAPELNDKEKEKYNFVQHEEGEGYFATAVENRPSGQSVSEAMIEAAGTFEPSAKTASELKTHYAAYWEVAEWVARNKYKATIDQLSAKISGLAPISDPEVCWDNLFYQILKQKDYYAKDLVMEILVLNQILILHRDEPSADFKLYFTNMMAATVVLPLALFPDEPTVEETQNKSPSGDQPLFSSKGLQKSLEALLTQSDISQYSTALAEVKKLQTAYEIEYTNKYNQATIDYNVAVDAAYEHATAIPKTKIDCATGCEITYYDYEDLVLPSFGFKPPNGPTQTSLERDLTPESYFAVTSLGLEEVPTYDGIVSGLEAHIEALNNNLYTNLPTGETIVNIGTMLFKTNAAPSSSNTVTPNEVPFHLYFQQVSQNSAHTKGKVQVSFEIGYLNAEVLSANYTATFPDASQVQGTSFSDTPNLSYLNVSLFDPTFIEVPAGVSTFSLSATLILGDGSALSFSCDVPVKRELVIGVGYIKGNQSSDAEPPFIPSKFGIRRLGIEDYKKVVSEVCCYREAEVSNIVNIMQGEFLSKTTTRERIQETTTTIERSTEKENLTDTTSTERFEMQTEIAKIMAQDRQKTAYANLSVGGDKWRLDAGGTYATANSKEESNRQAVTEATELTQRAMERIVTKFREEVVTKITESFKEENSHIYDNRTGDGHVSGVYRFINAIYKNQVYNYGKRLMYEFMIPEPSRIYRKGMSIDNSNTSVTDNSIRIELPVDPASLDITSAQSITATNFKGLAARYRAEVENPPQAKLVTGKAFHGKGNTGSFSSEFEFKIPENYTLTKIEYAYSTRASNPNPSYQLIIGNEIIPINPSSNQNGRQKFESQTMYYSGAQFNHENLPISITGWDLGAFSINLKCTLDRTPEAFADWQIKTYDAIIRAYRERLAEFENQAEEVQVDGATMLQSNPLFYREIELITLKRNCISYLQPVRYLENRNFYNGQTFQDLYVGQTQEMDDYASHAKFMEQAFEWDIMSYNFYPYYWGFANNWTLLYQTEYDDPLFKSFMQSGMARVIVSVRPGFEKAVMHYMKFGSIWNGGEMPVLGDPLYLGIVEELKEPEYVVEETWETVVPTSLIGIQEKGVLVGVDGLPCGGGCEVGEESKLVVDDNKLEPPITQINPMA